MRRGHGAANAPSLASRTYRCFRFRFFVRSSALFASRAFSHLTASSPRCGAHAPRFPEVDQGLGRPDSISSRGRLVEEFDDPSNSSFHGAIGGDVVPPSLSSFISASRTAVTIVETKLALCGPPRSFENWSTPANDLTKRCSISSLSDRSAHSAASFSCSYKFASGPERQCWPFIGARIAPRATNLTLSLPAALTLRRTQTVPPKWKRVCPSTAESR